MSARKAAISRDTTETRIRLDLDLDGTGRAKLATGLPFFEHMLTQVARHGMLDLEIDAKGDLDVDAHHTVEDVGIVLGQALRTATGDKQGIARYGHAYVPLDEALSRVVIDLSGRPGLEYNVEYVRPRIGDFDVDLVHEFFQGFVNHAQATLHVDNLRGANAHHQAETIFKAFGRALRMAVAVDARMAGTVPSTKGVLWISGAMLLIPAIDLKDGRCVRLKQGRMADADVFSDDPVAVARHWAGLGCRRLHVVDLDGAFAGAPKNGGLIRAIVDALDGIPVQVGGGIRSREVADAYLAAGAASIIVGTRAIEEPRFLEELCTAHPRRVILGLDARAGVVATSGWDVASNRSALEVARAAGRLALEAIVYTDIERDGMLTGLDLEATLAIARAAGVPVIASGGVANLEDVHRIKAAGAAHPGLLLGAITGRALYAGTLDFAAANRLLAA